MIAGRVLTRKTHHAKLPTFSWMRIEAIRFLHSRTLLNHIIPTLLGGILLALSNGVSKFWIAHLLGIEHVSFVSQ
jgi:hypothetical protein